MESQITSNIILWKTAIALQAVDGLAVSENLKEIAKKNIEGKISVQDAVSQSQKTGNQADIVAATMVLLLSQNLFEFTPEFLSQIHSALFEEILEDAGSLRKRNIAKKEWALDGEALYYPEAKKIKSSLKKVLDKESQFNFDELEEKNIAKHIAKFISDLWQIHPFEKFNTKTIAIFFIKYLEYRKFAIENDVFAKNPVYFRNSLARAAFCDKEKSLKANRKFLENLIKNMLFNGKNKLNHKEIHLYFEEDGVAIKTSKPKTPRVKKPIAKTTTKKTNIANKDVFGNDNPTDAFDADMETGVQIKFAEEKPIAKTESKKAAPKKSAPAKPKAPRAAKPKGAKKSQSSYNERKEKILQFLNENKSITNSQARTVAETSTETARKILVELVEEGIVVAEGSNKSRIYSLK